MKNFLAFQVLFFSSLVAFGLLVLPMMREASAHSPKPAPSYGYGKHHDHHRDYRKKVVRQRYWHRNQKRQHYAVHGYGRYRAPAVIIVNRPVFDRFFDVTDRRHVHRALETSPTGHTVAWNNPVNGNRYSVVPTKTWQTADSTYCREYSTVGFIGGREQEMYGTACRHPDGSAAPRQ